MTVSNRPNLGMAIGYIGVPKYIRACQTKKKLLKFCNILELFKNIKCKWICCVCVMYICDVPLFRQIRETYLNSICVNVYIMYCTCRLLTIYIVHTNRSSSICYISVYDDWWGTLTSESYILSITYLYMEHFH